MFLSTLPDLTPRDAHNLWYTASQPPTAVPHHLLTTHDPSQPSHDSQHQHPHQHHQYHTRDRDARRAHLERTPFARLRHDEGVMDRRRANVANYGTQWLKPPGVAKTLFQLREEHREAEEHAEAVRREQLAAQMAQAAQAAAEEDEEGADEGEEVDLDAEVPEAEGFGFDGEDSGDEEDMVTEVEDEGLEETENNAGAVNVSPAEEVQVREVRAAEDRLMEDLMAREDAVSDAGTGFGEEGRGEMLEEDDLIHMQSTPAPAAGIADVSMAMDVDMDADLDGGIPDADAFEYEHTDSEEEIDESTREISFAGPSSAVGRPPPLRRSVPRSSLRSRGSMAQSESLDISELLSGEGSSFMEASPYPRRRG